ncbi:hypothetical protein H8958_014850 [Nasalis larvatus]
MGSMLTLQCCWEVEKPGFESASCLPLIFQLGHWDGFSFGSYKHTYVETRLSATGGEPVRAGLEGSGSLVTEAGAWTLLPREECGVRGAGGWGQTRVGPNILGGVRNS